MMKIRREDRPLLRAVAEAIGAPAAAQLFGVTREAVYSLAPDHKRLRRGVPRQSVAPLSHLLIRLQAEVFGYTETARRLNVSKQFVQKIAPGASPIRVGGSDRRRRTRPLESSEIYLGGLGSRICQAQSKIRGLVWQHLVARLWRDGARYREIQEILGVSREQVYTYILKARRNGIPAPYRRGVRA